MSIFTLDKSLELNFGKTRPRLGGIILLLSQADNYLASILYDFCNYVTANHGAKAVTNAFVCFKEDKIVGEELLHIFKTCSFDQIVHMMMIKAKMKESMAKLLDS